MSNNRFHRQVRAELGTLLRQGILTQQEYADVIRRYPAGRWNLEGLSRWLMLLGAVTAGLGLLVFLRQYVALLFMTLEAVAGWLTLVLVTLLLGGRALRKRGHTTAAQGVELLGALDLLGLSAVVGKILDTGSGHWSALVGVDTVAVLGLAYLLPNIWLVPLACVLFFTFFGGETGYSSAWGGYWLGMNYPLRFVLAGAALVAGAQAHRVAEEDALKAHRGFGRVYQSFGLFVLEIALWLLALFGPFELKGSRGFLEGVPFHGMWTAANVGLLAWGARRMDRMMRGYAVTFLIIQGYTLFFAHLAQPFGWVLSTLIAGGTGLGLVWSFETSRRSSADG